MANAPRVRDADRYYWHAFLELSTERKIGGGRIPWSSIRAYAEFTECTDPATLHTIVRALDNYVMNRDTTEDNR